MEVETLGSMTATTASETRWRIWPDGRGYGLAKIDRVDVRMEGPRAIGDPMNPVELERLIRFYLSQMREENEFHPFEDLCFYVAKARISRNIIRATGPVGAGGDQGRDFETYRSFVEAAGDAVSFIGVEGDRTIVFSCTLKQDRLKEKILADVASICAPEASPVDHVVYFCEADVPVGERHGIQAEVRDSFGVSLDIHDGIALAGHLADSELYWVAQEYLRMPVDVFPDVPVDDEAAWYLEARAQWQAEEAEFLKDPKMSFGQG